MRVRAKRKGWDETLTNEQLWDMDPYEHESDDLEGELVERVIPARKGVHGEIRQCLVGGQSADPKTIEPIEEEQDD